MTIVYRAIWQDVLPDVTRESVPAFTEWVTTKWGAHLDEPLADNDHRTFTTNRGDRTVTVDIATTRLAAEPAERVGAVYGPHKYTPNTKT